MKPSCARASKKLRSSQEIGNNLKKIGVVEQSEACQFLTGLEILHVVFESGVKWSSGIYLTTKFVIVRHTPSKIPYSCTIYYPFGEIYILNN